METWNPEKAASWNQAPKLHFRLDYDQKKAELFVTSLEGAALCVCLGFVCALFVGWEALQPEQAGIRVPCPWDGRVCSQREQGFVCALSAGWEALQLITWPHFVAGDPKNCGQAGCLRALGSK